MAVSLQSILDDGTRSMREQASNNNLSYGCFSLRELITPQYDLDVESSTKKWSNWVGEHERERTVYRPSNRKELISAVVKKVRSGEGVRAVGSGHSHSNAPAPPGNYIELNPGEPGDSGSGGLNNTLGHNGWLKNNLNEEYLKRLEAGTILRRLNRHILHEDGKALPNMGSFDGQTIAGAVNTSTHGTGIGLKSISDLVESVEIVTVPKSVCGDPIVKMYRIEPSDGITDREAFEADAGEHDTELIQDDDIFRSVVVGYGCMGVVYAYTLKVMDTYWLREETTLMAWSELKSKLGQTKESVKSFLNKGGCRHTMILVNLAAEQVPNKNKWLRQHEAHGVGQHEDYQDPVCLVRRHYVVEDIPDKPSGNDMPWRPNAWEAGIADERWPPERRKKTARDIGKAFSQFHPLKPNKKTAKQLHNNFFHPEHKREPFVKERDETVWYVALRRLRDRGNQNSSEHRHPQPPQPAPSTELAVPVGDVVKAVDAVRERVRNVKQGDQIPEDEKNATGEGRDLFFGAPMGVRFTAPSEHFLSPEYERETAMVEVPLPVNNANAFWRTKVPALTQDEMRDWVVEPALTKIQDHLRSSLPARPHMGKHNTVAAGDLDEMYDHFDASNSDDIDTGWYQAYKRFNAFGTFDNKFTDEQLGLDNFTPAD